MYISIVIEIIFCGLTMLSECFSLKPKADFRSWLSQGRKILSMDDLIKDDGELFPEYSHGELEERGDRRLLRTVSFDALSYLLIDNDSCSIFQIPLLGDVLTNPIRFLFHDFVYMGLAGARTLDDLIVHIDPKSEICEVKGVKAYHEEVVGDILSDLRKTTTYIPLKVLDKTEPYELKLVRLVESDTMIGVLMKLSQESYNIEKLYGDSYKDQTTGLFNKNALNYHFSKNVNSHYFGFMDIDRFKAFNDKYSHSTGDQILHEVGKKLIALADKSVIFYRYGGDEFVFMTNGLDKEGTEALISKINEAMDSIKFFDAKITLSIGYTHFDVSKNDITLDEAVMLADCAMHESKLDPNCSVHYLTKGDLETRFNGMSIKETLNELCRKTKRPKMINGKK